MMENVHETGVKLVAFSHGSEIRRRAEGSYHEQQHNHDHHHQHHHSHTLIISSSVLVAVFFFRFKSRFVEQCIVWVLSVTSKVRVW